MPRFMFRHNKTIFIRRKYLCDKKKKNAKQNARLGDCNYVIYAETSTPCRKNSSWITSYVRSPHSRFD